MLLKFDGKSQFVFFSGTELPSVVQQRRQFKIKYNGSILLRGEESKHPSVYHRFKIF